MIQKALFAVVLAAIFSTPAWAQNSRFELGGKGGAGYFNLDGSRRGLIGVEVCAWCGGRYALFGEYSFWPKPAGNNSFRPANTAGVGLRIQRIGILCLDLCFFDVGIAVANGALGIATETGNTARSGLLVLGGGINIPIGERLYIRPQVRGYAGGDNSASSAEVGIGWRF